MAKKTERPSAKRASQSSNTALVPEVIDIPPDHPDANLALSDGRAISGFVQGLRGFFAGATALETSAKQRLERARATVPPTTQAEDDLIIAEIRGATADEKAIQEHWSITQVASRFHKMLVSGRNRGCDLTSEAKVILNGHHNRYVSAEHRRAAEEQERRRRAAEEQARAEQQTKADLMEAEAVKFEMASGELSEREDVFVHYLVNGTLAGTAARQAGFKNPDLAANRLLGLTKIVKAIENLRAAKQIREQKAAQLAKPLEVEVETVKAQVTTAGRTTWGAEGLDIQATLEAWKAGKHGIPGDIFIYNPAKLNEYGRSLHELVDKWPGVRHTRKTGVV